jgi:pyruvate/2-oxoglutarate/acetoin dehydrogenase E1 component
MAPAPSAFGARAGAPGAALASKAHAARAVALRRPSAAAGERPARPSFRRPRNIARSSRRRTDAAMCRATLRPPSRIDRAVSKHALPRRSVAHSISRPPPPPRRRPAARRAAAPPRAEAGKELFMWEALREGLDEEMERDPLVCMMGEDVGHYGGSYKVSYGLYKKYGEMRLLDTPICENGFMGMGVGAAMTGLRPIVEGMNMGFLLLAFNQISNNCGMLHYTSGGQYKVPMVIRGPGGVGRQLGAEHSQRLESYFQSIPGVQLVACSTAANAKALLKAAIRSDNPIIFFEHVLLYNVKGAVGGPDDVGCLERAEVVRTGKDVVIFCYSRMRYVVMQVCIWVVEGGLEGGFGDCFGVCFCAHQFIIDLIYAF